MKEIFKVEIDCPNCAAKIESALRGLDGVASANVNFMTQKLELELSPNADAEATKKAVAKTFKRIERDSRIYF